MNPHDGLAARERVDRGASSPPDLFRYRIRFRKEGLLRFISHNDLLRTWHRLLRRTQLPLRSTQGFHAKTKLSSPIPLALGLEGIDEVLDIELNRDVEPGDVERRLNEATVVGLSIVRVDRHRVRNSNVVALEYDCQIEGDFAQSEIMGLRERFLSSPSWMIERRMPGKAPRTVDIRSKLETIAIDANRVRFRIRVENGSTVRPEELLGALGLSAVVEDGRVAIQRTRVELLEPADVKECVEKRTVGPTVKRKEQE